MVWCSEQNISLAIMFFLSGRYYHGLYQVAESWNDFVLRNRYISVRIGYIF
jgi:hypothetical protein